MPSVMSLGYLKKIFQELAERADIHINGKNPWDIQVHDDRVYQRVFYHGTLGLGESYMDGWWDCQQLDELFYRALHAHLEENLGINYATGFFLLLSKLRLIPLMLINHQTKKGALKVGMQHYDIGNDLYQCMLDKRMNYTCAYWKDAHTLDQAQEAKLRLVCEKLYLKPGMRVLDIGCGWGAFAKFAAENYGVKVVGITISQEQLKLAREMCLGLPIELRFQDYRDVNETFDRIVSLGMFEHVGSKNYSTYMHTVLRCLKDDGLFLLHTIGKDLTSVQSDAWINKYIFPNSMLPSIKQIAQASEGLLVMEDWHNFGAYYDKTLMAWQHNFVENWPNLAKKYDERFYRMWNYYLLTCAGAFRARAVQLWQIVFSKKGVSGGYNSIR
jgi:cyclopropane-fatty-acyl-phospholipid synthase